MRNIKRYSKSIVLAILLTAGCFESIVAILQQSGWMESTHPDFLVTGTFPNPGPLGGFLSVISTMLWGILVTSQKKIARILLTLPFGSICYALVITDSRAGWMGALAGIVCVSAWRWQNNLKELFITPRRKTFAALTVSLIFGGIVFLAYTYRPISANGRLLIWRVCADMIADKPIFGFGINGFANNYMFYQAEYFRLHPDSVYLECADNVAYPYNEFIHLSVNFGLTGCLLVLILLYSVLFCPSSSRTNAVLKSGFISLLIFGCFSYPTYVFRLWMLFPLFIVLLENRYFNPPGLKIVGCVSLLACVIIISYLEIEKYRLEAYCKKLYAKNESVRSAAVDFLETRYEQLKLFPRQMDIYAQYAVAVFDNEKSIRIITDATRIVPSSDLFCDAGDLFRSRQDDLAAEFYVKATNMVPRRILPKYKLFLLYYDNKLWIEAAEIGTEILAMPVKVRGTKTLGLLADIKDKMECVERQLIN